MWAFSAIRLTRLGVPTQTPDAILRRVGRRIADLRRREGLTQEQLAERLDVLTQYLQRVEAGRENLTLRSLAKIASKLRVDISALLERD